MAWIWTLLVAVLLLLPATDDPPRVDVWEWLDKPAHALLFAVHCALLSRALASRWAAGHVAAAAFIGSGAYGVLLEALQIAVPGRAWEWWDVVADLAGAALGALLVARSRARLRRTP